MTKIFVTSDEYDRLYITKFNDVNQDFIESTLSVRGHKIMCEASSDREAELRIESIKQIKEITNS